jgi:predicted amidohydrolase
MMHVIVVPVEEAEEAATGRAPAGYRLASVSNTGLPAGKVRMTFLPEDAFLKPGEAPPPPLKKMSVDDFLATKK